MSDRTIRAAIASGARTPREVAERCGAGAKCGGCRPAIQELLGQAAADRPAGVRRAAHTAA